MKRLLLALLIPGAVFAQVVETPEESTTVTAAPPVICANGQTPTCNPVNDNTCDPCNGGALGFPKFVMSVLGSGPVPYDPRIPVEIAQDWYNQVVASCGDDGIAHYEASVHTIAAQRDYR